MTSAEKIIQSAGLNYDYYVKEAISIVFELEKGRNKMISETYINEKIKKIKMLFEDIRAERRRQEIIEQHKLKIHSKVKR